VKVDRDELRINLRQIIVLALLESNIHMESWQMNDLLVRNFPHLYTDSRPAAHCSLRALKNRGYVYQDLRENWRCRPLGKAFLAEVRGWLEEEEESAPAAAAAGGTNVVPLRPNK